MSERELLDWQRFEFGNRQLLPDQLLKLLDVHFATLCSTLINVMGGSREPVLPAAFFVLPDHRRAAAVEGMTDIDEIGAALDAMQGG